MKLFSFILPFCLLISSSTEFPARKVCYFESNETGLVFFERFRFYSGDGPRFGIKPYKGNAKVEGGYLIPQGAYLSEIRSNYVCGFWRGEVFVGKKQYEEIFFVLKKDGTVSFYLDGDSYKEKIEGVKFGRDEFQFKRLRSREKRVTAP